MDLPMAELTLCVLWVRILDKTDSSLPTDGEKSQHEKMHRFSMHFVRIQMDFLFHTGCQ